MSRRLVFCLALTCALLQAAHATAEPAKTRRGAQAARRDAEDYADLLIERARREGVAESQMWLALGHWRPTVSSRLGLRPDEPWQSEADGPSFFLSPDGPRRPAAELEATLRGFFEPGGDESTADPGSGPPEHAICRFPARFLYLRRALGIDLERIRIPRCRRFTSFFEEMQPGSASLVFSSYFLNNPASAFGHSFLRINRATDGTNPPEQADGESRELLDAGIDFGADVDTENAFLYGLKGLLGLFPGNFRRMPYYYKVRQYGDYESRDIWSYELDLDRDQLELLVAHLWELGSTHFDYYYLTENCSYHILGALAAAVPEADLMSKTRTPVLPSDTIKLVESTPGLVRAVRYRPSIRSQLTARLKGLDRRQRTWVRRIAADPDAPMPDAWSTNRRVAVLDAALDLLDVRHARALVERNDDAALSMRRRLLERRSDLRTASAPLDVEAPARKQPHLGHGSRRLGLGATVDDTGRPAVAADLRLAFHDLADPSDGYPELSGIEFLSARFRVATEAHPRFTLDEAALVRVTSINAVDQLELLPSWTFSVGARSEDDAGCDRCIAAQVQAGGGLARAWWDERFALFALLEGRVQAGDLDGVAGAPVRAGFGPTAGLRIGLRSNLILLGTGSWHWRPEQDARRSWEVDATLRWGVGSRLAIGLEGHARRGQARGGIVAFVYL